MCQSAVEREIVNLENVWASAVQKKEQATLEKPLGADYISVGSDGRVWTKTEDMAVSMDKAWVIQSYAFSEMKVRVYGDVAIASYLVTAKTTFEGKDDSGTYRYTNVWLKRDGRWQCVTSHATRVPEKK